MRCLSLKLIFPHQSVEKSDYNDHDDVGILVPCGKCVACLSNRRMDWVTRLQVEHRHSKTAYFVTLTYDEKHLRSSGSLCKRDLQLYLKRLRKRLAGRSIRYYAVGEYGSKYGRPHYHLLLFNAEVASIRAAWTDSKGTPIGLVHVGSVSAASVAYVTKYIVQKVDFEGGDRVQPFATMSRKYGIGGQYLTDEVVRWHRRNGFNHYPLPGNEKTRLPRFYRDKIWYKPKDRAPIGLFQRAQANARRLTVARKARLMVLENQEKERNYYIENYGDRWKQEMDYAEMVMQSRVKQKMAYTQTF